MGAALDALRRQTAKDAGWTGESPFKDLTGAALQIAGGEYGRKRSQAYWQDMIDAKTAAGDLGGAQQERMHQMQEDAINIGSMGDYLGTLNASEDSAIGSGRTFNAVGSGYSNPIGAPSPLAPRSTTMPALSSLRKVVNGGGGAAPILLDPNRPVSWQQEDANNQAARAADAARGDDNTSARDAFLQATLGGGNDMEAAQADRLGNDANARALDLLRKTIGVKDEGDLMYGDEQAARDRGRAISDMGAKSDELAHEFFSPGQTGMRETGQRNALALKDAQYGAPQDAKDANAIELQRMKDAAAKEVATLRAGGQGNAAAINALSRVLNGQRTQGADQPTIDATTKQFNDHVNTVGQPAPAQAKPRRMINGQMAEWDGHGWVAVGGGS